jgi:hypothetical protein
MRGNMPEPGYVVCYGNGERHGFTTADKADDYLKGRSGGSIEKVYNGKTPGDWLRSRFRREFGATMQKRYFD